MKHIVVNHNIVCKQNKLKMYQIIGDYQTEIVKMKKDNGLDDDNDLKNTLPSHL